MKSFVISLVLLVLIFFGICINAYFLDRKITLLYDSLNNISIDDDSFSSSENVEKIKNLYDVWEKTRKVMQLSFRRDLIRDFDSSVNAMKTFAKSKEYGDYLFSLESSFDLLDEMDQNNNFNLSVLF